MPINNAKLNKLVKNECATVAQNPRRQEIEKHRSDSFWIQSSCDLICKAWPLKPNWPNRLVRGPVQRSYMQINCTAFQPDNVALQKLRQSVIWPRLLLHLRTAHIVGTKPDMGLKVEMPFVPSSFLFLVVRPGATI